MDNQSCFLPAIKCSFLKLTFENTTTCRDLEEIAVTTWKRGERETPPVQTFKPRKKVAGVARFLLQNYILGTCFSGHDPFSGLGINCAWLQIMIVASAPILHASIPHIVWVSCASLHRTSYPFWHIIFCFVFLYLFPFFCLFLPCLCSLCSRVGPL